MKYNVLFIVSLCTFFSLQTRVKQENGNPQPVQDMIAKEEKTIPCEPLSQKACSNNAEHCAVQQPSKDSSHYHEGERKKKCIVFKCDGGKAHDSAALALQANFSHDYDIVIINIFEEVVRSIDPVRLITARKYSGEDLFNFCIQNELAWFANYLWDFGAWCVRKQQKKIENLFYTFLKQYEADCAISVIPIFNGAILEASKALNIPFLMITIDLDTHYFFNGICEPSYEKFLCTFIFDDPFLNKKIEAVKIPVHQKKVVGFPIRPQFFEIKNKKAIKEMYKIPPHKPVVLIMMGGIGSSASYYYLKEIIKIEIPIHIIICLGKNEKLRKKIEKLVLPPHVTITVVSFTSRISDFMAVADLLITKPGPTTLCEALQLNLPVLLHKTTQCAPWEYETYGFVERNNFGTCITDLKKVNECLVDYLTHREKLLAFKKAIAAYPKGNFFMAIRPLLEELLLLNEL